MRPCIVDHIRIQKVTFSLSKARTNARSKRIMNIGDHRSGPQLSFNEKISPLTDSLSSMG